MRVGLCQIDSRVGDLGANARRIEAAVRAAARAGADVALLPELVLTGFPPRDLLLDEGFVRDTAAALDALAASLDGLPPALVGAPWPSGAATPGHPGLYNALALVHRGHASLACAKRLLPAYDVFHDPRWFVPGPALPPIAIAGRSVGLLICEDLWSEGYPIEPAQDLVRAGAEVLFCASASPFRAGIVARRHHHAARATRAGERAGMGPRGVPVVYVNAAGAQDELVFDGGSFVTSAAGRVQETLPRFEEAVAIVTPFAADPGLAASAGSVEPAGSEGPGHSDASAGSEGPADSAESTDREGPGDLAEDEELYRALVLGVRGFAQKNGIRRGFLGLSGGIDSAVVLCLAAEALGAGAVTAVAMPSRFTDPRSTESAEQLARNLGAGFEIVAIDDLVRASESALAGLLASPPPGDTTPENLQARLRMIVLMAYVNRHGGMVLNTSNKTEISLGYGTLHGDLAGTLSVLGDVTKPHVYRLARFIERHRPGTIPAFIIERPPSAELRPDQVDPFDYPVVAPLVETLVSVGAAPSPASDSADLRRFRRMFETSEAKRWQLGIVLKVTEKAFGTGRLVPVTRARRST